MATILTDENFDEKIAETDKLVLVDFFADWCAPCRMLGPILEKIEKEMEDKIVLMKINLDQAPKTADKFNVDKIPTVFFFKAGKQVANFVGLISEDAIKEIIWKNL
jgi:thioredoxin 1